MKSYATRWAQVLSDYKGLFKHDFINWYISIRTLYGLGIIPQYAIILCTITEGICEYLTVKIISNFQLSTPATATHIRSAPTYSEAQCYAVEARRIASSVLTQDCSLY